MSRHVYRREVYMLRALIIVDALDILPLDFRQLLDAAGYSTELVNHNQVTLDQITRVQPSIIFLYVSKLETLEGGVQELFQNERISNIPLVALATRKKIANQLFSVATMVLPLPVSEQRLSNIFSLFGSLKKSKENSPWDSLTGFYTPSFFRARLQQVLEHSRKNKSNRFIVYTINLEYARERGSNYELKNHEYMLQGVASVLRELLRPTDVVSRFDANQFHVLIEEVADRFTPTTLAERMQAEIEGFLVKAGLMSQLKIDIGVLYCNSEYKSVDEILNDAQMALQMARQDYLGNYQVFIRNRPKEHRIPEQSPVRLQ